MTDLTFRPSEYSWFKGGRTQKASRIDFALVSAGIDQRIKETIYIPGLMTDHRALYLIADLAPFERGSGFWKFNTSLLSEIDFLSHMNKEIESTLESSTNKNHIETWEILKSRIKKAAQKYSRNKSAETKLVISQLLETVNEYESSFPLNERDQDLLMQTKADLEEKVMERAKGCMFRSKARWYEEGERNTKYFFALEKAKYNAKTCYTIYR